jgi:hypothetical protein
MSRHSDEIEDDDEDEDHLLRKKDLISLNHVKSTQVLHVDDKDSVI